MVGRIELATGFIAAAVERCDFVFTELRSGFEVGGENVLGGFFVTGQGGNNVLHLDQFVEYKVQIAQRCLVGGHGFSPREGVWRAGGPLVQTLV